MSFTYEQWQEEYMDDRPVEPYSESANAEQWAKIAYYLEDKLQEAFSAGFISGYEERGWHYLERGDIPPNEDKKYLFRLKDENRYEILTINTWKYMKNNKLVVAWEELSNEVNREEK